MDKSGSCKTWLEATMGCLLLGDIWKFDGLGYSNELTRIILFIQKTSQNGCVAKQIWQAVKLNNTKTNHFNTK